MQRFHFDQVDSTNIRARDLAVQWPGEPLLVTATTQSAGRGRFQRDWQSPRGGAWMSFLWPTRKPPKAYQLVALLSAVIVRRALVSLAPPHAPAVQIKWPNDLLINNHKVVGILCEQWPSMESHPALSSPPGVLVIGIGINVNFDPALLGGKLKHPATTLSAAWNQEVSVERVIGAVTQQLATALEQFEQDGMTDDLLSELQQHLAYVNTQQQWQSPQGVIEGRLLGIDAQGRLLLESKGQQVACDVGEFLGHQAS